MKYKLAILNDECKIIEENGEISRFIGCQIWYPNIIFKRILTGLNAFIDSEIIIIEGNPDEKCTVQRNFIKNLGYGRCKKVSQLGYFSNGCFWGIWIDKNDKTN